MRRKKNLIINTIIILLYSFMHFVSCDSYFRSSENNYDEIDPALTGTYSVRHWKQNIEDDNYTQCETEPSSIGLIGERTAAVAKDYEGFVLHKEIEQQIIEKDKMIIIDIRYDRKIITVTLDAKGLDETEGEKIAGDGVFYDGNGEPVETVTIKGKYGESIESITGLVTDKIDGHYIVKVANASMPVTMQWAGYVFQRWEPATIPAENCIASAIWRDERIKDYKVYHHFQDFSGSEYDNDGANFPEVQVQNGLKGFKTAAKINNYEGFFCVGTAKKETEHKSEISAVKVTELPDSLQKTIAEDDSTEIHLYYNRNIVHTTLDAGEVIDSATGVVKKGVFSGGLRQKIVAGRYGATIPTTTLYEVMGFDLPTCEGYTFGQWDPKTYPAKDGVVKALWLDNDTAFYSVFHHFQNISNDEYDTDKDAEMSKLVGKFGTTTQAAANVYEGFTCRGTDKSTASDAIAQKTIAKDGSTEIHIYYTRNVYTVTFALNDAAASMTVHSTNTAEKQIVSSGTVSDKYGAAIVINATQTVGGIEQKNPYREGYTVSWQNASPIGALIMGDRTYSASWVGNSSAIEINPPSLGGVSVSKSANGSAVVFTATVSNCTALDYQWFVNGKDVSAYSGGASVSGNTLTCTPSASVFAAGIYSVLVLVTDSNENVYSAMDSFTVTK